MALLWTSLYFYEVYNLQEKAVVETGLLVTKENEILHYRILDMEYSRSLIQKMFGLGTITLHSQDVTSPSLVIKNIKHSREFKDTLSELTEQEKQRLSVRRGEVVGGMPHPTHSPHMPDDFDMPDCPDCIDDFHN